MRLRSLIVAVLAVLCLAAPSAFGQAVFDDDSSVADNVTVGAPTVTLAHTTTTAANRILLVAVHFNLNDANGVTATSVSYGNNPLTLLNAINDVNTDVRTEVWYLIGPPTGTNTVTLTAGGMTGSEDAAVVLGAVTYSAVNQNAPPSATSTGQNDPATVGIAAVTTNDRIHDFISIRESATTTPDAPQTVGYNLGTGTTTDDVQAATSRRNAVTPTTTMSWDVVSVGGGNRRWALVAVNLRSQADVEVTQSALPDPVAPGGVLTYTFRITNNGPSSATAVTLTDTLPGTVTFISSSTTLGSCSGTSTVTCNLGTMTNGQTATVTINVTAPLTSGLIATNTGTVTTTSSDPATPNTASANAWVLVQSTVCGTPGDDGAGGTLAGIDNGYWPATTTTAAAGATSFTVGARRAGSAAIDITSGDLVLVIQMQDVTINSNNDDRYGDGNGVVGGLSGIGAGYTAANSVGRYEYVRATNTVTGAGGTFNFTGVGGGGGLVYEYHNAAAAGAQGARRYQIVRIPQWTTATLGATLTASSWNGTTGGVLAFDVAGNLALGTTTVSVNGLGFRGAAGLQQAGAGVGVDTDYRTVEANLANGAKGEGIAGTPEWLIEGGANTDVGPEGYPNGDFARGAPGNAGGGGTDGDPSGNDNPPDENDENSGGGGGANWGRGGGGGNTWLSNQARGGFGGGPYYDSPGRVVLGGGGGAGSRNNSTGISSSGGAGGGLVLIRAGSLSGTGTITANGAAAYNLTENDGGGGGGAGGSIVVLSYGGGIGGLTVNANGGRGGDAWDDEPPNGTPGERHGPGGGGGGGYIALNGTPAASSVTGGASGVTTTSSDTYGAQPGAIGNVVTTATFDQITGVRSACTDISVASADSPDPVTAGNNLTFTQSVTNNSAITPAQTVRLTQTTPPGTTFVSMTAPVGWSCTTPIVGGTGTVECTKTTALAPSTNSGNFIFVVATDPGLADGSTITQPVSTSTANPETTLANNTTSTVTTVQRRVDVGIVKTANPHPVATTGQVLTYTLVVTNNGPSRATNVVMTDPLPAGFSFTNVVPGAPTCVNSSGTITCTYATMNPGATNNITITGTVTASQTQIINTATVTRTEVDTNAANNSSTVTTNVPAPTVVHMLEMSARQNHKGRVIVTWNTSFEAENLGFNVYRQTSAGGREKVNKHLIAGGALFANTMEFSDGRGYRWKDKLRDGEFGQYYIEDIDIHGVRTLHGPITPDLTYEPIFDVANTATIADLGTNGGLLLSPRGVGAPNYPVIEPTNANRNQQYDLASQPAVKFMVTEEGWYRVRKSDMVAAGFDPGTDEKRLALFVEGVEQPFVVNDGGDKSFDNGDSIEFYGIGIDTISTGARAYWLVRDKGARLRIKNEKPKSAKLHAASTPFTISRIERTIFFTALVSNGEKENFFGPIISNAGATQELTVENLERIGNSPASLVLTLQGGTGGAHTITVEFNGNHAGTMSFGLVERSVATLSIPNSWVLEGGNVLRLTAHGAPADNLSLIESVRLTYPHRLAADGDALKVITGAGMGVTVGGFTTGAIRAFDITEPASPLEVGVDVTASAGAFSAYAIAPRTGTRTLLFLADTRTLAPAQIVPSRASFWNERNNSADLVIITAKEFAPAAEPLKARRDAEGVSTQVIDVQDLYDEFGFGARGPEALRQFVTRTKQWKRAPRSVLLVGDASMDPRNYLELGTYDFVPTRLVPTSRMKTSNDDWIADPAGTGLPSVAVGRIPARTLAEAQTMINRIAGRDLSTGPWAGRVSLIADNNDPMFDFEAAAASLASLVPGSLTTNTLLMRKVPPAEAQDAIKASFESLLVAYMGHGSTDRWRAATFTGAVASQLTNGAKLPVVASMTCLNGYYQDVFATSFSEKLLTNANGGAIAVWASSALTVPDPQMAMAREMFRRLLAGATLGEAIRGAKAASSDLDVRRSWILLGDPSMKLR